MSKKVLITSRSFGKIGDSARNILLDAGIEITNISVGELLLGLTTTVSMKFLEHNNSSINFWSLFFIIVTI